MILADCVTTVDTRHLCVINWSFNIVRYYCVRQLQIRRLKMAKAVAGRGGFHISASGNKATCNAKPDSCPLLKSLDEPFHGTEAEVDAEVARRNQGDCPTVATLKSPKAVLHNFVEPEIKEIEGYLGSKGWAGAKSGFSYKMSEVAKAIRGDIKEAMRAGYLPKDIKVSIRSRDNAIDGIVDFGSANDDYMYELSTNYGTDYVAAYKLRSDYQKTINKVQAIVDNYNYNSSNSQVDYFNRGFYGNVRELARRERALNRLDSLTKKKKRLRKEGVVDPILEAELDDALYDYRVETEVDKRVHRTLEDASTFRGHPALRPVSPERLIQLVNRQAIRKEVRAEYQSRY